MAKPLRRPVPPGLAPKTAKAQAEADARHEQAFVLYRDLGPQRSLRQLAEVLKIKWPATHVSHVTLQAWSKKGQWQKRVTDFDLGVASHRHVALPAPETTSNGEVDQVEELRKAASQALAAITRATHLTIVKPGDVKALLDAARMSMDLAERITQERTSTTTEDEVAAFMRELIGKLDVARRKDYGLAAKVAAEAACAEAGTTNLKPVFERAAAALGLRVDGEGKIVDAEVLSVEEEQNGEPEEIEMVAQEDPERLDNGVEEDEEVSDDAALPAMDSSDYLLARLKGMQ